MLLHTPPRRSLRLNNSVQITNQSMADNNSPALESIPEESTVVANITQPDVSNATTITPPTSDADSCITTNSAMGANAAEASRNATVSMPAHSAFNVNAMEQRLALLENYLQATQVQLRERDIVNESLRAEILRSASSAVTYASSAIAVLQSAVPKSTQAPPPGAYTSELFRNANSTVTYASSAVAASQPAMPQPTPPPAAYTNAHQLHTGVHYDVNSQPPAQRHLFAESRYAYMAQPTPFSTVSSANNLYNPYNHSYVFSSNSPSLSMPPPSNSNTKMYPAPIVYMPRKLFELPEFSGRPEECPVFYTAFVESTAMYGYPNFDNNQRLQKCLKGDAREMVKSLLIHPNNVSCIIEQLKSRFGHPEQLIRSQLQQRSKIFAHSCNPPTPTTI
ncbi:uncharacterized protein [Eurosta solidaginis]|uniref:uncharacterized protein n=1 Tax=Eurosta solidaginis TaxID=178769 RepID=UPI003530C25C